MPRLQAFLECVGQTLCEKGRKALQGQWAFADVLLDIARGTYEYASRKLPGAELRLALADCAAVEAREYERRVGELISEIAQTHAVPKTEFIDYMRALPAMVRQGLRRPTDPDGHTASEKLTFYKPEELAVFLPPRLPRFRPGDQLDGWTLTELRGMGQCAEVWRGEDLKQADHSPAALKFVTDNELKESVKGSAPLFTKIFELNSIPGILPLRSVYLETDPPCLEAPFVYGYDLAGLLFDWKWRYDAAKPEAALKLIRRLASIVAEAHNRGMVHRDLKPTNILLHPTEGGKFTLWVTDFGWGQIESVRSLELAKSGSRGEQQRLVARGACHSHVRIALQQFKKDAPSPRGRCPRPGDDQWYQLLQAGSDSGCTRWK